MPSTVVAVIVDIIDSRKLPDRQRIQAAILSAFDLVNRAVPSQQPLHATVGDEFQALYAEASSALKATLLARLALPEEVDCRFGLGAGEVIEVGVGSAGVLQDGSAWWLAREAVDEARRREKGRTPSLRGWFRGDREVEPIINSYLLSRDQLVGSMQGRARRLTLGALSGLKQNDLAEREGISQSAVSQALRRSGGASLIAGIDELEGAR